MNIGNLWTGFASGVGKILGAKSTTTQSSSNDFFNPEDTNGSNPFFQYLDAKSPSDFYTGWGHTGISTVADHVAILDKVLEDKNGKPIKDNDVFNMLTFELFRDLVSFFSIHGRGYVMKNVLPKSKTVLSLEVLNPQALEVVRWPKSSGRFGIMKYKYKQDQAYWEIMPENMIVITQFHPLQAYPYNNERGMSGLSASDYAIDADRKSDIWNAKFFENGGFAGNILLTEQALNKEVGDRILDKWERDHKGIKNGHATAILTHGIKPSAGTNQKDMDFSKMKEVARDVILGRLKVPKALIGLGDGVNVGNVVAFDRIFSRRTILPIAILLQEAFNKSLFAGVGKFRFLNVVPTDVDEILRLYALGLLTQNQALTELGYDSIGPAGDVYISSPMVVSSPSAGNQNSGDNAVPKGIDVSLDKCIDFSKKIFGTYHAKQAETLQSDDWMEKEWIEFCKRNDKYELKFAESARRVWSKQEDYIISKLNKSKEYSKKAVPELLTSDWYEVYYLSLFGVIGDIMKSEGAKANAQIGLSAVFGVPQDTVQDMIIKQVTGLQLSVDATTNEKLAEAIAGADTTFDAVKAVKDIFSDLSEERVKTISRSETVRAGIDATVAQWKDSGQVVSKIWYTVQDERTCPFCNSMHAKKVGLDEVYFAKGDKLLVDGQEMDLSYEDTSGPPLHPNCRCRLKAVLKK